MIGLCSHGGLLALHPGLVRSLLSPKGSHTEVVSATHHHDVMWATGGFAEDAGQEGVVEVGLGHY